jgi:hypothetical protein
MMNALRKVDDTRLAMAMKRLDRPDLMADAGLSDDLVAQMQGSDRALRTARWMPFHASAG